MNYFPKALENRFPSMCFKRGKELFEEGAYTNFDFVRNTFIAQIIDSAGIHSVEIKKKQFKDNFIFSCSCNTYLRHMICPHIAAALFLIFSKNESPKTIYENVSKKYYESFWELLAKLSYETFSKNELIFHLKHDETEKNIYVECLTPDNQIIFRNLLSKAFSQKIIKKYKYTIFSDDDDMVDYIIKHHQHPANGFYELSYKEKSELEERMNQAGYKSWLQKFEESFWFDFSKIWFLHIPYHSINVEYQNSKHRLQIHSSFLDFEFNVHKSQISEVLHAFQNRLDLKNILNISTEILKLNYSLKISENLDLVITPVLTFPEQGKTIELNEHNEHDISVFGKYLYFNQIGFYQFEREITYFDSNLFKFSQVTIPNNKIPSIIRDYRNLIDTDKFYAISPSLKTENYLRYLDEASVYIADISHNWFELDVKYNVLDSRLSFYDIYKSIKSGKRYMITNDYWIDLDLPEFMWIHELSEDQIEVVENDKTRVKLNSLHFFKLHSNLPDKKSIDSPLEIRNKVNNLLKRVPEVNTPQLDNKNLNLRDYQSNGYAWLWFLYQNKLSGLLCDDMGLGKTYQSIALLDAITMQKDSAKFLVVCPTSVISHWRDKLSNFKKRVNLHVYHGSDRELKYLSREKYSVILTSYGVMRNDLRILDTISFDALILDEIQIAKNKASLTNAALSQLNGVTKIGLTGTPIENDLTELKALFDIVLPNYLGSDATFKHNFIEPIEQDSDRSKLEKLHKLINPFVLRRTKSQVLLELPPKTEEIRKCELSQDQIKLYRDVLESRASSILQTLNNKNENIPYIHVFAILNYLKQICNHPTQLEKGNLDYTMYDSGKWDLFCELLEESLNSGFKVVVFTQYVNMLNIINKYLTDNHIHFSSIQGSTSNRGKEIDRFNNDPDCMVFTGSLKASGLGINLIGGSVVIHYDRWWNAAREDQATDRVHRIGQLRGVQVFKLLTEGTLEEKIDKIIRRKKKLMEDLIKADDAHLVKTFDRKELIELLSY